MHDVIRINFTVTKVAKIPHHLVNPDFDQFDPTANHPLPFRYPSRLYFKGFAKVSKRGVQSTRRVRVRVISERSASVLISSRCNYVICITIDESRHYDADGQITVMPLSGCSCARENNVFVIIVNALRKCNTFNERHSQLKLLYFSFYRYYDIVTDRWNKTGITKRIM